MARRTAADVAMVATVLVMAMATARRAGAQTSGANGTHDPSRIVESDGKFYFCSTGGNCASSTDGLVWRTAGLRIPVPSWATRYAPNGNQGIWAPDLIVFGGLYYVFYSFCGVPATDAPCAIGLYTTPTLDSTSPRFKLTDAGMVVNNPMNDATYQFSTIDPAPIVDGAGDLWLGWGSGYGKDQSKTQLWLTRLDATGLPLASDAAFMPPAVLGHPLQTGRREGAYLHGHGGMYFLFWNEGSCCSGTSSTYTIWVARSTAGVAGPYAGAKVFYAGGGMCTAPVTSAFTVPAAWSASRITTIPARRRCWARTSCPGAAMAGRWPGPFRRSRWSPAATPGPRVAPAAGCPPGLAAVARRARPVVAAASAPVGAPVPSVERVAFQVGERAAAPRARADAPVGVGHPRAAAGLRPRRGAAARAEPARPAARVRRTLRPGATRARAVECLVAAVKVTPLPAVRPDVPALPPRPRAATRRSLPCCWRWPAPSCWAGERPGPDGRRRA